MFFFQLRKIEIPVDRQKETVSRDERESNLSGEAWYSEPALEALDDAVHVGVVVQRDALPLPHDEDTDGDQWVLRNLPTRIR